MNVAILFSGGKDSINAIRLAKEKGWNIKYLLSVKPNRTDCYLFHFATVEFTKEISKILGYNHILVECDVADPIKEAEIIKNIVAKNHVDSVVLGGIARTNSWYIFTNPIRVLEDALDVLSSSEMLVLAGGIGILANIIYFLTLESVVTWGKKYLE